MGNTQSAHHQIDGLVKRCGEQWIQRLTDLAYEDGDKDIIRKVEAMRDADLGPNLDDYDGEDETEEEEPEPVQKALGIPTIALGATCGLLGGTVMSLRCRSSATTEVQEHLMHT